MNLNRMLKVVDIYTSLVRRIETRLPPASNSHWNHMVGNVLFSLSSTVSYLRERSEGEDDDRARNLQRWFVRDVRGLKDYLRLTKESGEFVNAEVQKTEGYVGEILSPNEELGPCGHYVFVARKRLGLSKELSF